MRRIALFSVLVVSLCGGLLRVEPGVAAEATANKAHYVANRPPLAPTPLIALPVGAVRPRGWLRTQLELQADGFTGHLTEISAFLKKEKNAWLSAAGEGDHGWEEVPYWLKGYANNAYLLGDPQMLAETKLWIEGILASQKPDGWFGPDKGRQATADAVTGRDDLWPNMVALFILQDYYDYSGDPRVIELMRNYFRWQLDVPEAKFLTPYWQEQRAADNLASVYWLYNRAGGEDDQWLLELGEKIWRTMARWDEGVINWHNVNIAQAFDSPAIYWQQSKNPSHLAAADRNWRMVRELYGQVPGGMFGGDENCRVGYDDPRQAIETCGVVEEMLSDEQLLRITGGTIWADRCEDACLNTLPATMTPDYKALRYLTAPNMPLSDRQSKAPGLQNSGPMLHMNPHGHRCCQHNAGHGWPYYTASLFAATPAGGLAAVIYAPCEVKAKVGDGTEVSLVEETDYPFDETVKLRLSTPREVRFALQLRIPGWCAEPRVSVNGAAAAAPAKPGSFVTLERTWRDGDEVTLVLPMEVRVVRWEKNKNSASVYRGPLAYSLRIEEKYVRAGGTDKWPAWEIHPDSPWNYGLVLDADNPAKSFEVGRKPMPEGQLFEQMAVPVALKAKGRRIPNWKLDARGLVGKLAQSPVKTEEPVETIVLIPMGAARLRIAAFPVVGDGPDAQPWPEDAALTEPVSASHCFEGDTVLAMNDNRLPKDSGDARIPRMTWWPQRGGQEWVQYLFPQPRTLSEVEVYWFDDTGRGQCRLPQSWQVLYLDGKEWKPVRQASGYQVERDRMNRVIFEPVTTSAVRLQVELQPEYSGGILEWRVK